MANVTIGIDISKSTFDAAILLENNKLKTKKFDNQSNGFLAFIEWFKKHHLNPHICLEATGIYGEALATYLYEAGYEVSVVNPAQIKGFAQSELARNKTDKADSQLIARFCKAIHPRLWKPKSPHVRELGALVRRLQGLQGIHHQEVNHLEAAISATIRTSIETIVQHLEKEIAQLKKMIKDHINLYPDLQDKQQLLKTIPGIGEATIAQILAFIGNIEDFENAKQLAAFVGLNPQKRQSGSSVNGRTRLSKIGNADLRKAFYFPAIVAKQHNPVMKAFGERLQASGKPTMLVISAIMRKLIHIIYGVLKSGKAFDPNLATA